MVREFLEYRPYISILNSNVSFQMEMRPGVAWTSVFFTALKGAAPLLAPGILALAGILAGAATYEHSALTYRQTKRAAVENQELTRT